MCFGLWARSIVFTYRYRMPKSHLPVKTNLAKQKVDYLPSFSRTVAYREFARGHDCRLQKPVTLYSFLQKFCVSVLQISGQELCRDQWSRTAAHLTLYEQNWVLITDQITSSLCIFWGRGEEVKGRTQIIEQIDVPCHRSTLIGNILSDSTICTTTTILTANQASGYKWSLGRMVARSTDYGRTWKIYQRQCSPSE